MTSDKPLPKALICDLDGTLCNIYHRQHYMRSRPKNWKAFYRALGKDLAHEFCRDIVQMYKERGFAILLVSGRPAEYKPETEAWLADHEVEYDALWMRRTEDSRPDFIVKKEIYEQFIQGRYNVFFVLDDRDQVVKMWRSQGLTCLQVAEGNF
ncbi:hypothetical protein NDA01_24865 [Trichocoleus desertorum AS-A10]|uniref:phosphatase domain-containing protein n=1 Tax=Trichocoleus desertorum TaxID=1481672 RepID=UPI00329A5F51